MIKHGAIAARWTKDVLFMFLTSDNEMVRAVHLCSLCLCVICLSPDKWIIVTLEVPRVWCATIGDRTFRAVLPSDVVDCHTLDIFRRWLKHFFMFLLITFSILCLVYFPVDLEVFYLGHVKNLYTIQYTVEVLCGCRHSSAHDNGQLHHGAVFWPAERSRRAGSQLCPRHWPPEWAHLPACSLQEEWDHGCSRWYSITLTKLLNSTTEYLTLYSLLLPYGYSYKASCARPG